MTTDTLERPRLNEDDGEVTQLRAIKSEWIKLRSLRSTFWSLVISGACVIGLGLLFSSVEASNLKGADTIGPGFDVTQVTLRGAFLAQLAIGVLGVMAVTGEYSTGMIRATISAVPRRLPVLWAKLTVFAASVFVLMGISVLVAFEAGEAVLASTHRSATLSSPGALRAVIGTALYLSVLALLAIGLGFLIRNTAGAIAALFGLLLVLPIVAEALPGHWANDVIKYLPMPAGTAITATVPDPTSLSPWGGFGVFCLYAMAAIGAGAVMLKRRDA